MHVSRSTKPLTNHSWQVWKSIYNNHIDVKISPTMIWEHKKQATLENAQSHKYKGTMQNMLETKHKNVDKTFLDFLLFMCFWIFDTKARKYLSKDNNVKTFKAKANKQNMLYKQPTK